MTSQTFLAMLFQLDAAGCWYLLGDLEFLLPMLPVFIVIVVAALVGLGAWSSSAAQKKRAAELQKTAADLSLHYSPFVSAEQSEQLSQFPLIQRGGGRESTNSIVAETDVLRLMLFDHKYVTGSGKNRSTHRQTVAWVSSPNLNMPSFNLSPETWLHRIGDFIIRQDIDFDDDPEFSNKFVLTGSDKPAIQEFFDAKRRLALQKINMPHIEAVRHGFVFYRPGKQIGTGEFKSLMSEAFSLYQTFTEGQTAE